LLNLDSQDWTAIATVVIAVATAGAAMAAWKSAAATRRTAEAQLFSQLMTEYSSPDMGAALNRLREQQRAWSADPQGRSFDELVEAWARHVNDSLLEDDPNDLARRRVASFFWKAARVISEGLLSGGLKEEVVEIGGKELVAEVVVPMELARARLVGREEHARRQMALFFEKFQPRTALPPRRLEVPGNDAA